MGVGGDRTITLSEASRFGGRNTSFSLMLKPVGSKCNLRCDYCYYLDKASSVYSGREPVMGTDLLELCIRDFCASCDLPELTVEWHGGEPLLAGMSFSAVHWPLNGNMPEDVLSTICFRPTALCWTGTGPNFSTTMISSRPFS